jgi:hypothetical protein
MELRPEEPVVRMTNRIDLSGRMENRFPDQSRCVRFR